jgi:hypothetical protein
MEEAKDREWAKDQNTNTKNEKREWKAQGENKANEILDWRIEGVEEDGWSLGNYRKRMDKDIVQLQIIARGFQ